MPNKLLVDIVKITWRLEAADVKLLRQIAASRGVPANTMIRDMVHELCEKERTRRRVQAGAAVRTAEIDYNPLRGTRVSRE